MVGGCFENGWDLPFTRIKLKMGSYLGLIEVITKSKSIFNYLVIQCKPLKKQENSITLSHFNSNVKRPPVKTDYTKSLLMRH